MKHPDRRCIFLRQVEKYLGSSLWDDELDDWNSGIWKSDDAGHLSLSHKLSNLLYDWRPVALYKESAI